MSADKSFEEICEILSDMVEIAFEMMGFIYISDSAFK
jgi:hypothetical protein